MTIQKTDHPEAPLPFSDYIKMLPTQWLFDHFLKKSGTRQILSSSAINDRIRQFSQPASLAAAFESLAPEQKSACALAYLMGDTGLPAARKVDLEDDHIRSFLVYASKNKAGVTKYRGFAEFEPVLRPLLAAELARIGLVKGKPAPVQDRLGNCANDIAVTMSLAAQGGIQNKKQGGLMRNTLLRMAKIIHEPSLFHEQEGLAETLVAYCLHAGLVQKGENGYCAQNERFEEWLGHAAGERSVDIVSFAVRSAGSWRTELLRETVASGTGEGWLSCSLFPEEVRKSAIDTLRILRWAGVVEVSRIGTDTVFGAARKPEQDVRQSAAGVDCRIVLMPDFSAVIPPESSPECLYRFGKIGVIQSLDRVYKGSISRETLNDSLSNGLEGASVLAWLEEWSAPANVVATVREWEREFYRLYITSGSVLITTDEKVSRQIAAFGPLKPFLEPVPSHAVFRIKRGAGESVSELLGQMGFDYRMPDRDRSPVSHSDAGGETVVEDATAPEISAADAWEPIVAMDEKKDKAPLALRGKKYGAGLKALDLNEVMHIIDYAILTATELVLDYAGSPFVKKGEYTVKPVSCNKGADPQLEAVLKSGLKKLFSVRKISKIGVGIS